METNPYKSPESDVSLPGQHSWLAVLAVWLTVSCVMACFLVLILATGFFVQSLGMSHFWHVVSMAGVAYAIMFLKRIAFAALPTSAKRLFRDIVTPHESEGHHTQEPQGARGLCFVGGMTALSSAGMCVYLVVRSSGWERAPTFPINSLAILLGVIGLVAFTLFVLTGTALLGHRYRASHGRRDLP